MADAGILNDEPSPAEGRCRSPRLSADWILNESWWGEGSELSVPSRTNDAAHPQAGSAKSAGTEHMPASSRTVDTAPTCAGCGVVSLFPDSRPDLSHGSKRASKSITVY